MRLRLPIFGLALATAAVAASAWAHPPVPGVVRQTGGNIVAGPQPAADVERDPHTNFILRCSGCHGVTGVGAPLAGIPTFPDVVGVFAGDDDGRTYLFHVPGIVSASLSNREIAGVMNYVMEAWAGRSLPADFVPFTEEEVTMRRAIPVEDVVAFRRAIVERLAAQGLVAADYPWP
ncbi:MAG: hypothetical protein KIS68_11720 [Bauldia sp.]|nr:hypothetical protein [Bauldia sp.]